MSFRLTARCPAILSDLLQEVDTAADIDFARLAALTEGYSGDDITNISRDAAMNGMRRKIAGKTPDEIKELLGSGGGQPDIHEPVLMEDFLQVGRATADRQRYSLTASYMDKL
jgi:SpoVK/Ycf46/Vps4 family AAA+-type ATPase